MHEAHTVVSRSWCCLPRGGAQHPTPPASSQVGPTRHSPWRVSLQVCLPPTGAFTNDMTDSLEHRGRVSPTTRQDTSNLITKPSPRSHVGSSSLTASSAAGRRTSLTACPPTPRTINSHNPPNAPGPMRQSPSHVPTDANAVATRHEGSRLAGRET